MSRFFEEQTKKMERRLKIEIKIDDIDFENEQLPT